MRNNMFLDKDCYIKVVKNKVQITCGSKTGSANHITNRYTINNPIVIKSSKNITISYIKTSCITIEANNIINKGLIKCNTIKANTLVNEGIIYCNKIIAKTFTNQSKVVSDYGIFDNIINNNLLLIDNIVTKNINNNKESLVISEVLSTNEIINKGKIKLRDIIVNNGTDLYNDGYISIQNNKEMNHDIKQIIPIKIQNVTNNGTIKGTIYVIASDVKNYGTIACYYLNVKNTINHGTISVITFIGSYYKNYNKTIATYFTGADLYNGNKGIIQSDIIIISSHPIYDKNKGSLINDGNIVSKYANIRVKLANNNGCIYIKNNLVIENTDFINNGRLDIKNMDYESDKLYNNGDIISDTINIKSFCVIKNSKNIMGITFKTTYLSDIMNTGYIVFEDANINTIGFSNKNIIKCRNLSLKCITCNPGILHAHNLTLDKNQLIIKKGEEIIADILNYKGTLINNAGVIHAATMVYDNYWIYSKANIEFKGNYIVKHAKKGSVVIGRKGDGYIDGVTTPITIPQIYEHNVTILKPNRITGYFCNDPTFKKHSDTYLYKNIVNDYEKRIIKQNILIELDNNKYNMYDPINMLSSLLQYIKEEQQRSILLKKYNIRKGVSQRPVPLIRDYGSTYYKDARVLIVNRFVSQDSIALVKDYVNNIFSNINFKDVDIIKVQVDIIVSSNKGLSLDDLLLLESLKKSSAQNNIDLVITLLKKH